MKRQEDIISLIKGEKETDTSLRLRITDMSSIIELDEERFKEVENERNRLRGMLEESEAQFERLKK